MPTQAATPLAASFEVRYLHVHFLEQQAAVTPRA